MTIRKVLVLFSLQFVIAYCQHGYGIIFESDYEEDENLLQLNEPISKRGNGYTDFSSGEVAAIVQRHNVFRFNTYPRASNMKQRVRILF